MISIINHTQLVTIAPELFLMVMICVTLLVGLFTKQKSIAPYLLAQVSIVFTAFVLFCSCCAHFHLAMPNLIFYDQFIFDPLACLLKFVVLVVVFMIFAYARQYNADRDIPSEYYSLGLLSTLGMMVLISGHDLLSLYLGLELFSLPIYAMVALERRQGRCIEAAMKYFIIGSFASGILLYGLSLLFGVTHSLGVSEIIATAATFSHSSQIIVVVALVFILAGVAFKLGAAPFHMWVPDVYEGASTSVTLFISSAPKVAAFGLMLRLVLVFSDGYAHATQLILIVMSALSIAIGNIAALQQTNLKRLLAYSSIAHVGYALLGFAAMTTIGKSAGLFYVITYALATCVAFGLLTLLSKAGAEVDHIDDLAGLSSRNPWLAFVMLMTMFSMAGIPPFVGFIAKVGLLDALIQVHLVWLAVFALVFAIIGSFYYLRIVKVMYFESPASRIAIPCLRGGVVLITLNSLAVLLLGLFPASMIAICHQVFQSF